MTTTQSASSQFSTISKIQLPSSRVLSNRTTSQPVLCGAGVKGVNGKFFRVSRKLVNEAPYFRNSAGFEISLAKGKQFWAILGPKGGAYYFAQAADTNEPPKEWTPHTLAHGACPPVLKMEVETEVGHTNVVSLTPRDASPTPKVYTNGEEPALERQSSGADTTRSGDTPTPVSAVCKMAFIPREQMFLTTTPNILATTTNILATTPNMDSRFATPNILATTPNILATTPNLDSRSPTRDSRHTSCYEDNDMLDSPLPSNRQRIPRQEKTGETPQMAPLLLTPPIQPPVLQYSPAHGAATVPVNLQAPTAQVGTIYLPSPMHQNAPQQHMFMVSQPIPQGMPQGPCHGLLFDANAVAHGIAISPGLGQLASAVYSNMTGYAAAPQPFTLQMPAYQRLQDPSHHPQAQLLRPETNPDTQLRSSTYESHRSAVSHLGGEPVNGRPRTASSGVIAPPSSSAHPTQLNVVRKPEVTKPPRYYKVAVGAGITYRMTANFKDKFEGQVAAVGHVVEAEIQDSNFIRCSNGLWLPKHYMKQTLLEPCDHEMQHFTVNVEPGLSFRKSKDLGDLSKRAFAKFGDDVAVHRVEDNWACIPGGVYLPLTVTEPESSRTHLALRKKRAPVISHGIVAQEQQSFLTAPAGSDAPSGSIEVLSIATRSNTNSRSNSGDETFAERTPYIARNESYDTQISMHSG